jgi:threonylcarbamoyladenosine tRNA methylthiotransferase MtaB
MDCSDEVIEIMARDTCFAPHFHLPLQHASDRVLGAMRRPYTLRRYRSLVERIRDRMPSAAIGTDVIVGFPGETDEDFEALARYLVRSPITHAHVFPYSDRPGTEAATMTGKPTAPVVRARAKAVRSIAAGLTARFRRSQVGTVQRGLTLENGSTAITGNYLRLSLSGGPGRNEWVRLRVASESDGELLTG